MSSVDSLAVDAGMQSWGCCWWSTGAGAWGRRRCLCGAACTPGRRLHVQQGLEQQQQQALEQGADGSSRS